jgi:hypothetical protein
LERRARICARGFRSGRLVSAGIEQWWQPGYGGRTRHGRCWWREFLAEHSNAGARRFHESSELFDVARCGRTELFDVARRERTELFDVARRGRTALFDVARREWWGEARERQLERRL